MKSPAARPPLWLACVGAPGSGRGSTVAALDRVLNRRPATPATPPKHASAAWPTATGDFRIDAWRGAALSVLHTQCDGVVLVVSAAGGITLDARRAVFVAAHACAGALVVFISHCDTAPKARVAAVEGRLRDVLRADGAVLGDVPIVRGAALPALRGEVGWEDAIVALGDAIRAQVRGPARDPDGALFATVEDSFTLRDGRLLATACIARGSVYAGQAIECLGDGRRTSAVVASFERVRACWDDRARRDSVVIEPGGLAQDQLAHGDALVAPGTGQVDRAWMATLSTAPDAGTVPVGELDVWLHGVRHPATLSFADGPADVPPAALSHPLARVLTFAVAVPAFPGSRVTVGTRAPTGVPAILAAGVLVRGLG